MSYIKSFNGVLFHLFYIDHDLYLMDAIVIYKPTPPGILSKIMKSKLVIKVFVRLEK